MPYPCPSSHLPHFLKNLALGLCLTHSRILRVIQGYLGLVSQEGSVLKLVLLTTGISYPWNLSDCPQPPQVRKSNAPLVSLGPFNRQLWFRTNPSLYLSYASLKTDVDGFNLAVIARSSLVAKFVSLATPLKSSRANLNIRAGYPQLKPLCVAIVLVASLPLLFPPPLARTVPYPPTITSLSRSHHPPPPASRRRPVAAIGLAIASNSTATFQARLRWLILLESPFLAPPSPLFVPAYWPRFVA
ncbi:hypothetical protein C8R47DRAFT_1321255 [Mycena vitilis]|nr:hypothetical protein C8R47DRAFT_1321255 [Mycena vitilis]